MKLKKYLFCFLFTGMLSSCNYLDVVPDNVATIDNAFRTSLTAEKYLFTCYSWLPAFADPLNGNPAFAGVDEVWFKSFNTYPTFAIALGNQHAQNPAMSFWTGTRGGKNLFRGIRECNIFLENIHKVQDMSDYDRNKMIAEVKFLKAYYHFYLMRMYGPIPIIETNLPVSASVDEIKSVTREPIDEVVSYIIRLLDEAIADLPETVMFEVQELGRITKPIAMTVKAQVLVTAASPLFNGNTDYPQFINSRDDLLFNSSFSVKKWEDAAKASREAIDLCHSLGLELHHYKYTGTASELTKIEMSIRTSVTQKWNSEVIWGGTNSRVGDMQTAAYPRIYPGAGLYYGGYMGATLNMVERFYSKNGIPIKEDKEYDYDNRYQLRKSTAAEYLYVKEGYTTAELHFNREPRFYADVAFDGGRWLGQGNITDVNNFYIEARVGGTASGHATNYSTTGYWPKKVVNYLNVSAPQLWTVETYPWPIIRLADLYLLFAEASNEAYGPNQEAFEVLNLIRARAGLKTVQESWDQYSTQSNKYTTTQGLRDIIHDERTIELAFEGSRFWDLRRWKLAITELNNPIRGWDIQQELPAAYYNPVILHNQTFGLKDYFAPIQESDLLRNKGIGQSPGW